MALIVDIALLGGITGALYALLALGFTLIFGVSRVVNLAHGTFFMLGAYAFALIGSSGFFLLPLFSSLPASYAIIIDLILAPILIGIIGGFVYRLTVHYVIEDEVAVLVVTLAVALIAQQILQLEYGSNFPRLPRLLSGSIVILGVTEPYSNLLAFTVSLGLFASLWLFISRSKIGRAMKALSQDREAAMLMGVNAGRLYMLTMGISAAFAAIAGIFIAGATTGVAQWFMWLDPLSMSFAIVILGGLGSIKGTFIGGFIIGYARTIVEILFPQGGAIGPAVPFTIMVLILFLRPKGLFGKRIEMEE